MARQKKAKAVEVQVEQQASGLVYVSYGMKDNPVDLVGMTVGRARKELVGPYNIDPECEAVVNGEKVTEDYVLVSDDRLEFVKLAGEKAS